MSAVSGSLCCLVFSYLLFQSAVFLHCRKEIKPSEFQVFETLLALKKVVLLQTNFYKQFIMNITRENIDELNAVVKVDIAKEDYSDKVDKILKDYRKNANIPGFRKGHVPMGMVKKQYGKAVLVDEVNKLLQDSLNKYLTEEKLDVLGNPLPKEQDNFDWDSETYTFEFELGSFSTV